MNYELGFSLIELMVVIAIVVILAAVAIPAYSRYLNNVRVEQTTSMIGHIFEKANEYVAINGVATSNTEQLGISADLANMFPYSNGTQIQWLSGCQDIGDNNCQYQNELLVDLNVTTDGSSIPFDCADWYTNQVFYWGCWYSYTDAHNHIIYGQVLPTPDNIVNINQGPNNAPNPLYEQLLNAQHSSETP